MRCHKAEIGEAEKQNDDDDAWLTENVHGVEGFRADAILVSKDAFVRARVRSLWA